MRGCSEQGSWGGDKGHLLRVTGRLGALSSGTKTVSHFSSRWATLAVPLFIRSGQMQTFARLLAMLLLSSTMVLHPAADQTYLSCPSGCNAEIGYGVCEVRVVCYIFIAV